MSKFNELCASLTGKIKRSYEEGITVDEAEKLAGEFLYGQLAVGEALRTADLDARMRKTGVKAVKASVYMEAATAGEKKPSDVMLNAQVDLHEMVQKEQDNLDKAEVERDALENYLSVFREAHIHFRGIAKGRFE